MTNPRKQQQQRTNTFLAGVIAGLLSALAAPGPARAQPSEPVTPVPAEATVSDGQVPPPAQDLPVNPPRSGAPVEPTPTVKAVAEPTPSWLKALSIGGGAILWYYQPVQVAGADGNVSLFFANLLLDGKFGAFGLHIEPRFRDSRLRAFFPGPVWAQEVYASATLAPRTVLKAGKAYSHFGLFWDNSFYGNVQVYDGLKLDPDYGLSLEGAVRPDAPAGLRYYAQFFLVDGQTNVSLDGRDTISLPGGRRRDQSILRAEPFVQVSEHGKLTGGLSGEYLEADLGAAGKKNVFRGAVDATFALRAWSIWAEYTRQNGQTVTGFPIAAMPATGAAPGAPGQASSHNNYALAGTQYVVGPVTVRYNVSTGRYEDLSISEWMHVPAAAVALNENFTVLAEYVNWTRYLPGNATAIVDRSLDVTLSGHF
jgi:hypothetical protein